jgi:hypothetical protein
LTPEFLEPVYIYGVSFMIKTVLSGAEVWGPKAVGLRFKLTRKGKAYLRELEAAAKCEPKIKKKAFIKFR